MGHFKVFEIPATIERELIAFYLDSPAFPLQELNNYRAELSQHYGVYFLYYRGDFELYRDIAERNRAEALKPIYVGKAVSTGGRTGRESLSQNSLFRRLSEHSKTIEAAADTLHTRDFDARVIPMGAQLVGWAEGTMIRRLKPLWNTRLSGFGIHDPGSGRYNQRRSVWDQIHPGRSWASKMESVAAYDLERIRQFIADDIDTDLDISEE
jgi:hypothetical protein